jgi:hypothetical protein
MLGSARACQLAILAFFAVYASTTFDASVELDGTSATTVPVSAFASQPYAGKPCIIEGGEKMCRPSFLIIGAGKSGTSSLYYYLQAHPQVELARGEHRAAIVWR